MNNRLFRQCCRRAGKQVGKVGCDDDDDRAKQRKDCVRATQPAGPVLIAEKVRRRKPDSHDRDRKTHEDKEDDGTERPDRRIKGWQGNRRGLHNEPCCHGISDRNTVQPSRPQCSDDRFHELLQHDRHQLEMWLLLWRIHDRRTSFTA
ncbi:MAG: hypothetical protein ACXWLC_10255 [Rhizomicrobium sp.]